MCWSQSQGQGGGKCEGDDLEKHRGFVHKEGNETPEHISKCLREDSYPHEGPMSC